MKKRIIQILSILAILLIVLAPMMLLIDVKRYTPMVLMVWLIMVAYYVFIKTRK